VTAPAVRPLASADAPAWRALWEGYLDFYGEVLDPVVTDGTWQGLLAAEGMAGLAAELDGRVVGIAHVVDHASTWSLGGVSYLEDLYVDPEVRGRGVGRALIDAVVARARSHGLGTVHWITASDNPARSLYRRAAKETDWVRYEVDLG
jgi:GNAT superfamily N-acetyltransferase